MKALITKGCHTDHGGIVQEADNIFLVEGIPVHVEGMRLFNGRHQNYYCGR